MSTNDQPKRVLLVSYSYPPVPIIGSIRFAKLAKYLPDYGWLPTVLTVSRDRTNWGSMDPSVGIAPDVRVVRAPFLDIATMANALLARAGLAEPVGMEKAKPVNAEQERLSPARLIAHRVSDQFRKIFTFPDRYILWFPSALALGIMETRRFKYDVICATNPHGTNLLIAAALHRISGVPWVADFRDPWTQSLLHERTPRELRMEQKLEEVALRSAKSIVAVTEPMASCLKELHGDKDGGVLCITNGYDPEEFEGKTRGDKDDDSMFTIVYTGQVTRGKRDPSDVLLAVKELIEEGIIEPQALRLKFYGPKEPFLLSLKESFEFPEIIEIEGIVPREESISIQRKATALLVVQWRHPYTTILHGGKAFEYLGSRRPILASIHEGGDLGKLLKKTKAGEAGSNKEELKGILKKWFEEYRRTGTLKYQGLDNELELCNWRHLAGEYAGLLDSISSV